MNGNRCGSGVTEPMRDHVAAVRDTAVRAAVLLRLAADAGIASLLHDLGKYAGRFMRRLDGQIRHGLDHSSAGALCALRRYGHDGYPIALAIAGHHVGLPSGMAPADDWQCELSRTLTADGDHTGNDFGGMARAFAADGFTLPSPDSFDPGVPWTPATGHDDAAQMFDVRMLFSALVDADYIETEAHFNGDAAVPRRRREDGPPLDARAALRRVLEAAARKQAEGGATAELLGLRKDLFDACLAGADQPKGVFTLTAPTGAGKTLAMLAFALQHATKHKLRRVVMVIPYLTIIEQTARTCRELFGDLHPQFVLEDHSFARVAKGSADHVDPVLCRQRLLAEDWDAPIVLTTSVAALESLHANDPRRCRKLHNLAGSVLLFDEVQTIPPHLAELTLASLSRLAHRFDVSVVFSTATQPAFDSLDRDGGVTRLCTHGWHPREIVPDPAGLFRRAEDRYQVSWRHDGPTPWATLADHIRRDAESGPVIAIVNLKKHAARLLEAVQAAAGRTPVLHLSTNLCPMHRARVLAEAFALLTANQPLVLVATQCIEAGVDISAPVVYRALAPLESIAQAAGRCNRHGTDPRPGRVIVFTPEDEGYPPGAYEKAAKHTRAFLTTLRSEGVDIDAVNILSAPDLLRRYYRQLYQAGIHETAKRKDLLAGVEERDFPEVSRLYRLIDQDAINLLVPYDRKLFRGLVNEAADMRHLNADWVRRARPLAVSVRRPQPGDEAAAAMRPLPDSTDDFETEWFALQELTSGDLYDCEAVGLKELKGSWIA